MYDQNDLLISPQIDAVYVNTAELPMKLFLITLFSSVREQNLSEKVTDKISDYITTASACTREIIQSD